MAPANWLERYPGNQGFVDGLESSTEKSPTVHDITELAQLVQETMDILYRLYTTNAKPKKLTKLTEYDTCIKAFRSFCECAIAGLQDYYNLTQDWLALIDANLNKEPSSEVQRFAETLKTSIGGVLAGFGALHLSHERFFTSLEALIALKSEIGSKHLQNSLPDMNAISTAQQIGKLKSGCRDIFDRQDGFWKAQDVGLSEVLSDTRRLPSIEAIMAIRDSWSNSSHIVSAAIDSIRQSEDAIDVAPSAAQRRRHTAPRAIAGQVVRIGERLKLSVTHKDDERPSSPPPITQTGTSTIPKGPLLIEGAGSDNEEGGDSDRSSESISFIDAGHSHSPLVEEPESSSGSSSEMTIVEPSDHSWGAAASESPKAESESNKKNGFHKIANKTTDGIRNYTRKFTNTLNGDGTAVGGNGKRVRGKEFMRRLFSGTIKRVGGKEGKKESAVAREELKGFVHDEASYPDTSRVSKEHQGDMRASLSTAVDATPAILSKSHKHQNIVPNAPLQTPSVDPYQPPRTADVASGSLVLDATIQKQPKSKNENKGQVSSKLRPWSKFTGKTNAKDAPKDTVTLQATSSPSLSVATQPLEAPATTLKVHKGYGSGGVPTSPTVPNSQVCCS